MSGVHDDLALREDVEYLRAVLTHGAADAYVETASLNALDRVEAEIARLREERDAAKELERAEWNPLYGRLEQERRRQEARAEAAEARCARLQQALRPFIPTGKPRIEHIGRFTCVSVRVNLDEYERAVEALAGLDTPADSQPVLPSSYPDAAESWSVPVDSQEDKT